MFLPAPPILSDSVCSYLPHAQGGCVLAGCCAVAREFVNKNDCRSIWMFLVFLESHMLRMIFMMSLTSYDVTRCWTTRINLESACHHSYRETWSNCQILSQTHILYFGEDGFQYFCRTLMGLRKHIWGNMSAVTAASFQVFFVK